jgi:minor histocompatibility antigen H13
MWHFSDEEEVEVDEEKKEEAKEESSTKGQKSLLMRLFSGEIDAPASKDGGSQSKKTDKKKTDDSKPKKARKEEKDQKSLDLISFSVSIPRKSKSETKDTSSETLEDEEDKVTQVYLNADGDNEPPLKRRRRSVKKPASE